MNGAAPLRPIWTTDVNGIPGRASVHKMPQFHQDEERQAKQKQADLDTWWATAASK